MHSTRLCKNILIVLLAFSALFGVVACSNLSGGDAPVNSAIQPANGVGVVRGTINSNQSTARTALPTEPTASKYKITATASGFATVEQEFLTTDFELALPYNGSTTWMLKASALNAINAEVMSGTATVTLSDANPTAAQDINIAYSQTGTGSVNLNISWGAASIVNVKYELVRGSTKKTDTATTSPLTISQTDLAAGAYSLAVEFYGADNSLLYRIDETVNVYANLETTQFESGAPYISGGGIDVDQNLLDNFKISTIYVGGRGLISNTAANDSNNGSQFAPLATLKKAVEKANVTGAGIENIIVQGNTTEAEYPAWAEIIYTGAVPLTVTGKGANRSTTVAVNGNFVTRGDLTIKNLTLSGAELTVENSGVLTVNEATLQDHTGWGAGGIKIVDNGKATVTNCTIKDNQVINDPNANPVWGGTGGGLSINTTSTVELKNCIIQNNTAQRMGGAIYIAAATKVTLENCTITGNTAGTSGGAIYMATGANLSISGNTVIGGTGANANTAAQDGGGICIQGGELKFSGGTITGNKATTGKGTGIYNNASLIMSGTAQVASGNDIFLATVSSINKTITINDEFDSAITTVAYLTLEGHAVDDTVLEKGGTLTAITPAICNKFKLLKADGTEDTAHKIAPNALNDAGVLANVAPKLAKVFLDAADGDDTTGNGTEAKPVATLAHALEILDVNYPTPTIVVASEYTLASGETLDFSNTTAYPHTITIERGTDTGAVMKITNGTVTIKNVIFDGKKTDYTADNSLLYISGSSTDVTIGNGAILKDNNSINGFDGGGIYNEGTLTISGGEISGNTSYYGGGIYNKGTLTISGGEISDNTASYGGGILNTIGKVEISGGEISGNIANNEGGGIYNEGTLTISGGEISDNTASYSGGGIYNYGRGTVTISDGTISSNTVSDGDGGGIYNYDGGTVTISGGTISGNTASGYGGGSGGGIYNGISGTVTISGGTISGNLLSNSTGSGKGIYNRGTLEMSGAAQIADDNDVWLYSDKFITITGALNATGTVANITLNNLATPSQYAAGTQVLDLTAIAEANRATVCGKFVLLDPDGTENTDFVIKPDSADSKKGVLADATAKLKKVYLSGATSGANKGDDTNDGATETTPVATLKHALEILDTDDTTPTIVVVSKYTIKSGENLDFSDTSAYPNRITIQRGCTGDLISITGNTDIKRVIIDGNKTEIPSANGRLLSITDNGTVTIGDGAELINNVNKSTSNYGGAVYIHANSNITRNVIIEGTAVIKGNENSNGSAVANTFYSKLTINGGTIEENTGSAIYNSNSTLTMNDGSIIGNTATSGGGAIYNSGELKITGGTINGNIAKNGGAIYNTTIYLTISGGTISGNKLSDSTGNGKAIYTTTYVRLNTNAQIAEDNDIYLGSLSDCYIMLNTTLNPPDPAKPVAVITPYRYKNGDEVLGCATGKITEDVCKMFAITPNTSVTPATEWNIVVASNEVRGNLELASKFETVYLNGTTGNDTKFGDTEANAVKTLAKALYHLDTKAANPTIVVLKEYSLATGETLDFSDATTYLKPVTIKRGTASGNVIKITTSGEVILDNVILDGNCVPGGIIATSSTGALLSIGSSGKVTINETTAGTTILKNNNNKYSGGGAINSEGTLKINGGTITSNSSSNNGGGIYNKGTLTINGGTISDNTANNGGGIFAYGGKTTISNGSNINIIDNIANNNGGGICNNLYNSEVEINGGNISGNTAGNNGGGVSNAGIITFTGGTISGNMLNGSGSGKDIYNNATMQMSGTVIADEVYLNRGKYITVTGAFSHAATIKAAKIVLNNSTTPSQYAAGTQVLAAGGTLSEITPGICDKFVLLDKDDPTIASTEFNIVPNPADTTQGILAAAQGSGGIILALAATYDITFGSTLSSNQIQRGNTLSFTVKENGFALTSASYTIDLKQNGTGFKSATTNSIEIPSTLPAGVYDIYITITVGSNTYDYTKQITVTI